MYPLRSDPSLGTIGVVAAVVLLSLSEIVAAQATRAAAAGDDIIVNGSFEDGSIGWSYMASAAVGSGAVDAGDAHAGKASFKLINKSAFAPHVYHRVWQTLTELTPYTTYRATAWAKGRKAGICWVGGGPGWLLRHRFPEGDFDWRQVTFEFTTGADAQDFDLMVASESPTEALWVDDVSCRSIKVDAERLERVTREFDATLRDAEQRVARLKQRVPADAPADPRVRMGLAVAERFVRRLQPGGGRERQSRGWSILQLEEIGTVLDETERLMGSPNTDSMRWPTGGRVIVRDGVFLTRTGARDAQPPSTDLRPWYFYGYGHFTQVFKDLPNWRDYGVSLVQDGRVGPSAMAADGSLLPNAKATLASLKDAAAHGVKVDWLISPHYFPEWAIKQAPDLPNGNGGFLGYNIDHPLAREVNERWLKTMLAEMNGDTAALFSLCLTNEPVYMMSGRDPHSRPKFTRYLADRHDDVAALNALYGTGYRSFDDVPVPPHGMPADVGPQRAYYDWCRFNMRNFADWHAWLRDTARSVARDVKVHAKVMVFFSFDRDKLHWGVDPELFCDATDIAGCDAYAFPPGDNRTFDWHGHAFWYDLLHSFRGQSVFNSENHVIPDGYPPTHVPPALTRAQFWQGGLHHQGATTTWVWEEQSHPSLAGSIYFRPGNVYGAGRAMIDLNRFAPEVAAINRATARVAILYAPSSVFWEPRYGPAAHSLYNQLNFSGKKVTFVSEQQLAEGRAATDVKVVLVPHATHATDAAVKGLEAFVARGGTVIRLGDDDLTFDEYHRPRHLAPALGSSPKLTLSAKDEPANAQVVRAALEQAGLKLHRLTAPADDQPAWGVEFRVVPHENAVLLPIINHTPEPQTVRLSAEADGKTTDLLSGKPVDLQKLTLPPLEPMLIRVN